MCMEGVSEGALCHAHRLSPGPFSVAGVWSWFWRRCPHPLPPPGGHCCEEASCTSSVTLTLQQKGVTAGRWAWRRGGPCSLWQGPPGRLSVHGHHPAEATPATRLRVGPAGQGPGWRAHSLGLRSSPHPASRPQTPTPGDSDTLTFAPSVLKLFPFNPRASQGPWL